MFENFFRNTRKPKEDFGGRLMIKMMNKGHQRLAEWGLEDFEIETNDIGLDVGCGGGRNIDNLLKRCAFMHGIDYSPQSVKSSIEFNADNIKKSRTSIKEGNVRSLDFDDESMDFVTAFETIYFWPEISESFKEVHRVLKPGGGFLICNEDCDPQKAQHWINMIDMYVYTPEELNDILEAAGFVDVRIKRHKNGRWLCVTAKKQKI